MALPVHPHHLLSGLRKSGAHFDLTIRCGDSEFKVHKCVVCPQSTFFEKACEEGRWKEGYTNVIELKAAEGEHPDPTDDDPRAVKLMIDFLYLDDYDPGTLHVPVADPIPPVPIEHAVEATLTDPALEDYWGFNVRSKAPPPQPETIEDIWGPIPSKKKKGKKGKVAAAEPAEPPSYILLEMHAKMFAIASKYDIKSLERTAREKFKDQFDGDWSAADLIAAIEIVFNHTPEREVELRGALKDAIVQHAAYLVQKPGFGEAVSNIDGLVYDLFCRKTYAHA